MTGFGIFKLFRYSESNLKQYAFQKADMQRHYICQTWVNEEKLLVGVDSGKVLLFESGELKGEFSAISDGTISRNDSTAQLSGM